MTKSEEEFIMGNQNTKVAGQNHKMLSKDRKESYQTENSVSHLLSKQGTEDDIYNVFKGGENGIKGRHASNGGG